jgi:hypothetical protein
MPGRSHEHRSERDQGKNMGVSHLTNAVFA